MSVKKIFYNTVIQSLGKLVSLGIGFANILLLTRYLEESGFGAYTTIVAFMGFFGILADLGLYLITTQLISREGADEKRILGNVFSLRVITVLLTLVAGAMIALLFPYAPEVKGAMFIAIANFAFVSATQVLVGIFQKHLVFYKLVASEIVGRLIALTSTIYFMSQGFPLAWFIFSLTLGSAVHFAITFMLSQKMAPFRPLFEPEYWKYILSQSWPLAFSVVLNLIYFKTDTLILSVFRPVEEVGVYGAAYRFFEVLINFPAMFAGLIMPFLARFAYKNWPAYKSYLQNSMNAIILFVIPMVLSTLFFARPIIDVVGGQGGYLNADKVLQILIFAAAVTYLGQLLGYTVVSLNLQKKMVKGYLFGAVIGAILYFVLIPRYSYYGAATATVIVEFAVFAYAYFLTSKHTKFYPSFSLTGKALLAAVPMCLFYYFTDINLSLQLGGAALWAALSWILEVLLGLSIYSVFIILLKAVPRSFLGSIIGEQKTGDVS